MKVLAALLLLGATIVPVAISFDGHDHFRLPKQLVFYGVTIAIAAVFLVALLLRRVAVDDDARRRLRMPAILAVAGLAWAGVATLLSTNRTLSVEALIWGAMLVVVCLGAAFALRNTPVQYIAAAVLLPGLVNAVIVILQATHVWNPWVFPEGMADRLMRTALLGNPDDVGVYLAAPALFALVLAATQKRWRVLYAICAAVIIAGLLASETLTAIGALSVAVLALIIVRNPKLGLLAVAAFPIVLTAVIFFGPTRDRGWAIVSAVRRGRWGRVVTGRLLPFATAWHMFADHPVAGVGPGCFKFHYMDYRIHLREAMPRLYTVSGTQPVNFAEAHNDHLQILAELGLPGYAILIAGILFIGLVSRARPPDDERSDAARSLAFPLAVLVLVVMIAQFALQLAAPAYTYALLGGLCLAWRPFDVVA
jgi:putative inorganic carbon (hco3(-)) transporter